MPTFFELKKNEILKPLLNTIKSKDLASFIILSPSSIYSKALVACLDSILIPELYPKFLRLIFQIISTYCNFISRKLNNETKSKGIEADILLQLIQDINLLKNFIIELQLSANAKQEIENSLQQLLDPCIRGISEITTRHCISNLESIKTIPSLYRMTGRDMPNNPSAFIFSIFKPMKMIEIDLLPKDKIINKVLIKYIEIIHETKQEISKIGDLIQIYNPDSLDTQKMLKQIELDEEAFLRELESLGFTIENNEIIRQLLLH